LKICIGSARLVDSFSPDVLQRRSTTSRWYSRKRACF
jgi:hypothetical protein